MTLELTLSRAEMKRLAGRLVAGSRDQANYRAITSGLTVPGSNLGPVLSHSAV